MGRKEVKRKNEAIRAWIDSKSYTNPDTTHSTSHWPVNERSGLSGPPVGWMTVITIVITVDVDDDAAAAASSFAVLFVCTSHSLNL